MMIQAKQAFPYPFFMEVFIISAWQIWKQCNNSIFNRGPPSFSSWRRSLKDEARLQAYTISANKQSVFLSWVDSCV
jgi:hypothetical protein